MTKLTAEQLDLIRREWHTHASGAIIDLFAHIDALAAELSQANEENANLLAANKDAHLHFDCLMEDYKAQQAELAALRAGVQDGWKLVPVDDDKRSFSDPAIPDEMVYAGADAIDKAEDDLNNYVAGETIDWDAGMIAVAVYRAMIAAAPQPPAQAVAHADDRAADLLADPIDARPGAAVKAEGLRAASKLIADRRDDYIAEHGSMEWDTGAMNFPGNGAETVGEWDELIEMIDAEADRMEKEGAS